MGDAQRQVFYYLDDGHPESSDYDNNYLLVTSGEPPGLLRRLIERLLIGRGEAQRPASGGGEPLRA